MVVSRTQINSTAGKLLTIPGYQVLLFLTVSVVSLLWAADLIMEVVL